MTWQNAAFVVVGVSLMALLEWTHHRFDLWRMRSERNARGIMLYLGAALVLVGGVVLIIFALKMK